MSDELHFEWPEVRLGDHARVKARLGWKGLKAEEYVLDGPISLAAPNLRGNRIDFDRVDHLPQWRYDESRDTSGSRRRAAGQRWLDSRNVWYRKRPSRTNDSQRFDRGNSTECVAGEWLFVLFD